MNKKGATIAMNNKLRKQMQMKSLRLATAMPVLRFSPTAWAKLLFLRDYGETEVGGFGIAAGDDLLFVEDVQLVKQDCSWAHVAFDDESVADFFDAQVDQGRKPEQFARLWLHTHPGECPRPSLTDEETFERVFGRSDWAVMFIIAREGQTYARLRFNVGPGGAIEIPVKVDYSRQFSGSKMDAWENEYLANVCPEFASQPPIAGARRSDSDFEVETEPSELNDPFFVGDETDGWYGLSPDDELVTEE
jgi:proteasome lid subunit RPN8/RPN11